MSVGILFGGLIGGDGVDGEIMSGAGQHFVVIVDERCGDLTGPEWGSD